MDFPCRRREFFLLTSDRVLRIIITHYLGCLKFLIIPSKHAEAAPENRAASAKCEFKQVLIVLRLEVSIPKTESHIRFDIGITLELFIDDLRRHLVEQGDNISLLDGSFLSFH